MRKTETRKDNKERAIHENKGGKQTDKQTGLKLGIKGEI